ncbi:MAG TPA: tetratricopeptide repeat protein [Candidatus Methanoperedens sp.]|nr:tetratricopeptide repeat protein [Candidatus Methanoperedens sp.]
MRRKRVVLWGLLALSLLVAAVFLPVVGFDFVNFDDNVYISDNPVVRGGITWEGVRWALTATELGNYPLTWVSHMVDVDLFGLDPRGHHAMNLLFHTANTLLLFVVLAAMTGAVWRSLVVAALFGVHPTHVEPVAWIAERKELLSALFWILSLLAYLAYARAPRASGRRIVQYCVLLFCFTLGMSAKPMLATLPFILLLLDFWPLGRWTTGSGRPASEHSIPVRLLLLEKAPLLLLAVPGSVLNFSEQASAAFSPTPGLLFFKVKVANALTSYTAYVGKMLWPSGLAIFYPHPLGRQPLWMPLAAAAALALVSFLAIRMARRHPAPAVGWYWYLGSLVPVIGLVQLGEQGMADRYTYLPFVGLFVSFCWAGEWRKLRPRAAAALGTALLLVLAALAVTARRQTLFWKDSVTVFSHALDVTRDNHIAHANLGAALMKLGRNAEAEEHLEQALRLRPMQADALLNVAILRARANRLPEAVEGFNQALAVRPGDVKAHYNLGTALCQLGRTGEAITQFDEVLRLQPGNVNAHNNLGVAYFGQGNLGAAEKHFRAALALDPGNKKTRANLEAVLSRRIRPSR